MVGVNVPSVPMAFHSFGGWKNSFLESCHAVRKGSISIQNLRQSHLDGQKH